MTFQYLSSCSRTAFPDQQSPGPNATQLGRSRCLLAQHSCMLHAAWATDPFAFLDIQCWCAGIGWRKCTHLPHAMARCHFFITAVFQTSAAVSYSLMQQPLAYREQAILHQAEATGCCSESWPNTDLLQPVSQPSAEELVRKGNPSTPSSAGKGI